MFPSCSGVILRYLGGKTRLAKHISAAILADTDAREVYIEPMVGGGSVLAAMAPHFERVYAGDVHEDLILMYQAMQSGWEPPLEISEELYRDLKYAEPSALRGFVGFGCSFGGKWFGGRATGGFRSDGFPRNYVAESRANLLKTALKLGGVEYRCGGYQRWPVRAGHVVYLDPPYAGTTGYSGTGTFDHRHFWDTARAWRELGAHVYVSEFSAPDDWTCIWEKERSVGVGQQSNANYRIEKDRLFK